MKRALWTRETLRAAHVGTAAMRVEITADRRAARAGIARFAALVWYVVLPGLRAGVFDRELICGL